ncbi:hypothetical protein ACB094_11G113200 [Castanea mollissima]
MALKAIMRIILSIMMVSLQIRQDNDYKFTMYYGVCVFAKSLRSCHVIHLNCTELKHAF